MNPNGYESTMRANFFIQCLAMKPLRRPLSVWVARVAIWGVLLGHGAGSAMAGSTFVERVVPISVVPEDWTYIKRSVVASPDSTRVAFKVTVNAGDYTEAVMVDNMKGISTHTTFGPIFSPDSKNAAWATVHGSAIFLVINHHKVPVPDPVTAPIFSPDSQRTAYVARDNKKRFVVVDGRHQLVVYDEVPADSLAFSPDSKHYVFAARRGEHWMVVFNGQEGEAYLQVGRPVFSPDSQRLAYWALKSSGMWVVVVDGQEDARTHVQQHADLKFSPDSKRLGVIGNRNGRWQAIIDGQADTGHDALGQGSLVFSPDSAHVAYAVQDNNQWRVQIDGEPIAERGYDALLAGSLVFSNDSLRFAYAASRQGRWFVVEDGIEHKPFVRVKADSLGFSPDSSRLAYIASVSEENQAVVIDGRRWAISDQIDALAFSPNSVSVVWVARSGSSSRLFVDGTGGVYKFDRLVPGASLAFSQEDPNVFNTVVMQRPGPVFFHIEAQLYPQATEEADMSDERVISANDDKNID